MKSLLFNVIPPFLNKNINRNGHENIKTSPSHLIKQLFVALAPLILTVNLGMITGYSAILLPQLQHEDTDKLDLDEASWIASMAPLPMALGSILGSFLVEKCGRKSTHMIICPFLTSGWFLIYWGISIEFILAGRFITGFCCGILGTATGVYIAETSAPKYRGLLLAGVGFAVALGLMVVHLLGTFLHWTTTALITSTLPVLAFILLFLVPESPGWLAKKGKIAEAEDAFRWCRGTSDEAKQELTVILQRQLEVENNGYNFKDMLCPEFLKPLGIIVIYIVSNQWAGVNAITFYTVSIMKDTVGDGLNEYLAMLIIDLVRVLMSVLACVLIRNFGRRPLAIVSGIGTTLSLLALSAYSKFSIFYPQSAIPMTALVAYMAFISIGFVPLPWTLIGELFPLKYRSLGSGLSAFMAFIAFFSVVKTSPSMFETLDVSGSFLVYGTVACFATVFVWFVLPETKGKLLYQIEDRFKNKKETKSESQAVDGNDQRNVNNS